MTTTNWPALEQPREKIFDLGAKNLSDAELLSLLLRSGGNGQSALELARDLLHRFDGLAGVFSKDLWQIAREPNIGPAKSATLAAMPELGHRLLYAEIQNRQVLPSSRSIREYLRARFRHCLSEIFSCLFLTAKNHVLKLDELFHGTIDGITVYPREVVKRCLTYNAAAIILVHNHPSGIPEPSQADIAITRRLRTAVETVDVHLLDHLIVGGTRVVSLAERGLL